VDEVEIGDVEVAFKEIAQVPLMMVVSFAWRARPVRPPARARDHERAARE